MLFSWELWVQSLGQDFREGEATLQGRNDLEYKLTDPRHAKVHQWHEDCLLLGIE